MSVVNTAVNFCVPKKTKIFLIELRNFQLLRLDPTKGAKDSFIYRNVLEGHLKGRRAFEIHYREREIFINTHSITAEFQFR